MNFYFLLKFVEIKLPVMEPLKKLKPTIKPIGKLIVLLTIKFTSFLFELFCKPIIKIKNKEKLNATEKNIFLNGNNII